MSNLSRKNLKPVDAVVEELATTQVVEEPTGKMTLADKKAIVKEQAIALGITLDNAAIAQVLKEANTQGQTGYNEFITTARSLLSRYIQKIEQEGTEQLQALANDFSAQMTESNTRFARQVEDTFRNVGGQWQKSNGESKQTFNDLLQAFEDALFS
jgi:hypothetical protein